MSDARAEILARIRGALRDVPLDELAGDVLVPRGYRRTGSRDAEQLAALFSERLLDFRAHVRTSNDHSVSGAVEAACRELGLRRLAVAPGVPAAWRPGDGIDVLEDHGLAPAELDRVDGALTGCAAAIAETGTLILDGGPRCGRRALTLIPDHHICIVERSQLVELVPEGLAAVADAGAGRGQPITLISGPSASSDIELTRVEGVHGPRHLLVLLVDA